MQNLLFFCDSHILRYWIGEKFATKSINFFFEIHFCEKERWEEKKTVDHDSTWNVQVRERVSIS